MFFQNPFTADFRGNWVLGDRNQSIEFPSAPPVLPIDYRHKQRADDAVMSYNASPYDLSGYDTDGSTPSSLLTLIFAIKTSTNDLFKNWGQISVDLSPTVEVVTQAGATSGVVLNVGSGYQTGINLSATGGHGTGLKVNIVASNGVIVAASVANPGTGYHNTDVVTVSQQGSGNNGTLEVLTDTYLVSAVTADIICQKLNANPDFTSYFIATYTNSRVQIRQRHPVTQLKFYVQSGGAEEIMQFNYFAGVAEFPTYFLRHSVGQGYKYDSSDSSGNRVYGDSTGSAISPPYRFQFADGNNAIVVLDPVNSNVDFNIIQNAVDKLGNNLGFLAGWSYDDGVATRSGVDIVKPDWVLLKGRSGLFTSSKATVNGNVTTTITWNTGAQAGDLATKTIADSSAKTSYVQPYTLLATDLPTV